MHPPKQTNSKDNNAEKTSNSSPEVTSQGQSKRKRYLGYIMADLAPRQPPYLPFWFFMLMIISVNILYIVSIGIINIPSEAIPEGMRDWFIVAPIVPVSMYLLTAHGALAYLFTNIASNKVETFTPLQATARFFAAIPVAAGLYYIGPEILQIERETGNGALLGLMFLAGFSMEVFVQGANKIAQQRFGIPPQTEISGKENNEPNGGEDDCLSAKKESNTQEPQRENPASSKKSNESPERTTSRRSQNQSERAAETLDVLSKRSALVEKDILLFALDRFESEIESIQSDYETKIERLRNEHESEIDRYETEIESLEAQIDDLQRQLAATNRRVDEHKELVESVQEERSITQRHARAGLWTKTKWALFGMSDNER